MTTFFEGLAGGLGKNDALRQAQLELIEAGRKEGRSAHPYNWAAFTLSGDWHRIE
jgi:CHAT domain-containing protein